MDRRDLLKVAGGTLLAGTSCGYAVRLLTTARAGVPGEGSPLSGKKMGMVVDVGKCVEGCTACMDACRAENNVAHHENRELDVYWIRKVTIRKKPDAAAAETLDERKHVILLCNHCDNPPCAQVCPVRATFKREDGIVIVDHHRCIGCRYCMIACPYNARYFNFKEGDEEKNWPNKERPRRSHGVAESCTLCAHRLDTIGADGKPGVPACVEACQREGHEALAVGDMNDPKSTVFALLAENKHATKRL
ncbi:MAG: 4Fe-4S dicluster domain-containing protein, partial [Planctomycetes bacterium]|nr:4Fe-4S dicluster domain-containing protein [Planctomycetota bacterium]